MLWKTLRKVRAWTCGTDSPSRSEALHFIDFIVSIGSPAPKTHQWTIYFCRWGFGLVNKAQCFQSAKRIGGASSSPDFSRGFSRHLASRHSSRNTLLKSNPPLVGINPCWILSMFTDKEELVMTTESDDGKKPAACADSGDPGHFVVIKNWLLGERREFVRSSCRGFVAQWLERLGTNRKDPEFDPSSRLRCVFCLHHLSVLLPLSVECERTWLARSLTVSTCGVLSVWHWICGRLDMRIYGQPGCFTLVGQVWNTMACQSAQITMVMSFAQQ